MWNDACRWARPRLALLAGDELTGDERRRAERHLIGCPVCRDRMEALRSSLGALRTLGETGPDIDAPSLWPALARRIQESRHPEPTFGYGARPAWIGLGVAASVSLAVGLAASWSMMGARTTTPIRVATPAPIHREIPVAKASGPAVSEVNAGPTVADASTTPKPDGEGRGRASTSGRGIAEPTQ